MDLGPGVQDGVRDKIGHGLPGELIDDVEELELPGVRRHVELEVEGPEVVGMGGGQARRPNVFAQPDAVAVVEQFERVTSMLGGPVPRRGRLRSTEHGPLAFGAFPSPLERLHRERQATL
jgi:hypothetical protein